MLPGGRGAAARGILFVFGLRPTSNYQSPPHRTAPNRAEPHDRSHTHDHHHFRLNQLTPAVGDASPPDGRWMRRADGRLDNKFTMDCAPLRGLMGLPRISHPSTTRTLTIYLFMYGNISYRCMRLHRHLRRFVNGYWVFGVELLFLSRSNWALVVSKIGAGEPVVHDKRTRTTACRIIIYPAAVLDAIGGPLVWRVQPVCRIKCALGSIHFY